MTISRSDEIADIQNKLATLSDSVAELKDLLTARSEEQEGRIYTRAQFCKAIGIGWRRLLSLYEKYDLGISPPTRHDGENPAFTPQDVVTMKVFLKKLGRGKCRS